MRRFNRTGLAGTYVKPLNRNKALDKGSEFWGNSMVYGLLVGWGLF